MSDFTDAQRLDFMLNNYRKVVIERLPTGRLAIYVEEGFMGDVRYPAVKFDGELSHEKSPGVKRRAIDLALEKSAGTGGQEA
ncbi:hypothetical protein D9M69_442240 [compost metagenome]